MGTIMARKKGPALLRAKGRPMVRDATRRAAPHHEAEQKPRKQRAFIVRSPAKPGVSKNEGLHASSLYRLMAWLSPAYPVGAFSYSSGIEWAVEAGDITDASTLKDWLAVMLNDGGGFCDAVFFAHSHRAAGRRRGRRLARAGRTRRRLRAVQGTPSGNDGARQCLCRGDLFCLALRGARPAEKGLGWTGRLSGGGGVLPPPVMAWRWTPALPAFLQAVAANWVSAGVRLIPLGQSDGQRVLAALEPVVAATAQRALATALDDIGAAAFRADLAVARHETQYTRLFRS